MHEDFFHRCVRPSLMRKKSNDETGAGRYGIETEFRRKIYSRETRLG